MEQFSDYLSSISSIQQRQRTKEVLNWVAQTFPDMEPKIAWNQPMFTVHNTFIIAFSTAAHHLAVSPERAGMEHFTDEIATAGYGQSKMMFRIKWDEPVDYPLLSRIISFNRSEKADCKTFWRK